MPVSNLLHLPAVVHFAGVIQPSTILDVGVGMGTYGFLLRQYFDIIQGRLQKEDWQITIDGIEIFESYRNAVWSYAYNMVHIGDVRDLVGDLPGYDLALCNDVLEHFELDEATGLLDILLNKCRTVIVTTPNTEYPQGAWGGNEAETHRCLLKVTDLPDLVAWKKTGITNCYVMTRQTYDADLLRSGAVTCPVCRPAMLPLMGTRAKRLVRKVGRAVRG